MPALCELRPSARLALDISGITGRFSAVVMNRRTGAAAVANSAVRVDPIFVGQTRHFHFIGTQASTICELLHGELRYNVEALYTFIGVGFFGTDDTAFRGVAVLPPLCVDACLHAVQPIAQAPTPVILALSGGKDSRLVLLARRRAGIDVRCYTIDRGADNSADVYVAPELAKLLQVEHEFRPSPAPGSSPFSTIP